MIGASSISIRRERFANRGFSGLRHKCPSQVQRQLGRWQARAEFARAAVVSRTIPASASADPRSEPEFCAGYVSRASAFPPWLAFRCIATKRRCGPGAAVSSYSNPESHFWNWSKCRLRRCGDGRRHRQEKTAPAAGLSRSRLCVLVRGLRWQCELSSSSARSMHQRPRSQSRKGERLREVV